ncbi:MAG: hypothetical protein Q7S95_00975 [bacterium]|nr:hypothetical protein [bacterium]
MKQRFLALLALLLAATATPAIAAPVCTGYQPVAGDTLWDLAASRLDNPFRWTEVWAQNPQIHQPGRRYVDGIGRTIVLVYPSDCLAGIGTTDAGNVPAPDFYDGLQMALTSPAGLIVMFLLILFAVLFGWWLCVKPLTELRPAQ